MFSCSGTSRRIARYGRLPIKTLHWIVVGRKSVTFLDNQQDVNHRSSLSLVSDLKKQGTLCTAVRSRRSPCNRTIFVQWCAYSAFSVCLSASWFVLHFLRNSSLYYIKLTAFKIIQKRMCPLFGTTRVPTYTHWSINMTRRSTSEVYCHLPPCEPGTTPVWVRIDPLTYKKSRFFKFQDLLRSMF